MILRGREAFMKENIKHVLLRVETVTRDEEGKEEQISLQVPGIVGGREGDNCLCFVFVDCQCKWLGWFETVFLQVAEI